MQHILYNIFLIQIFIPCLSNRREASGHKRKGVLFADGVAPGCGTSSSENSGDDDDENKPKKLSSRGAKNKKNAKNNAWPSFPNEPTALFLEKENSFETKVRHQRK